MLRSVQPSVRGLKNIGNSCFLNVALQALTSVKSFHRFLHEASKPYGPAHREKPLSKALQLAVCELSLKSSSPLNPDSVTANPMVRDNFLQNREQQDAEELLQILLSALDAELHADQELHRMMKLVDMPENVLSKFARMSVALPEREKDKDKEKEKDKKKEKMKLLLNGSNGLNGYHHHSNGSSAANGVANGTGSANGSVTLTLSHGSSNGVANGLSSGSSSSSASGSSSASASSSSGSASSSASASSSSSEKAPLNGYRSRSAKLITTGKGKLVHHANGSSGMNGHSARPSSSASSSPAAGMNGHSHSLSNGHLALLQNGHPRVPPPASRSDLQILLAPSISTRLFPLAVVPMNKRRKPVRNPFTGVLASVLRCRQGHMFAELSQSSFNDLSLSINAREGQKCLLEGCLREFTGLETVREVYCDHAACKKKGEARKRMSILRAPSALCLHLRRLVGSRQGLTKVDTPVEFPLTLDLTPFCGVPDIPASPAALPLSPSPSASSSASPSSPGQPSTAMLYELVAVIEHHGSATSGHYTTYRRAFPDSFPTRDSYARCVEANELQSAPSWFHISDETCQPVKEEQVLASSAYMLFYERKKRPASAAAAAAQPSAAIVRRAPPL
jgi:ubiquitin C-terminal hydrolase